LKKVDEEAEHDTSKALIKARSAVSDELARADGNARRELQETGLSAQLK
jgi:hypothetical protein